MSLKLPVARAKFLASESSVQHSALITCERWKEAAVMRSSPTQPTGSGGNRHKPGRRKVLSLAHSAPKALSSRDGEEDRKRPDTRYEHSEEEFNWKLSPQCGLFRYLSGKDLPVNTGNGGSIPWSGRSLEKEMAIHSSILPWEILWTEELGGLQSMG